MHKNVKNADVAGKTRGFPCFCWGGKRENGFSKPMTDPWDERDIYLHEWLICMVNVGNIVSTLPETTFLLGRPGNGLVY